MKEPYIEAASRVTRESCRAQARAKVGRHNGFAWLICALMTIAVVLLWHIGSFHARWMTVLLAVLLAQTLLGVRFEGWRLYSGRNESVTEVRLTFDAEGVCVKTCVEETRIGYGAVTGLWEDDRYAVILLKHHTPLVLLKSDVPDGRAAELQKMLSDRTGLTFRRKRA